MFSSPLRAASSTLPRALLRASHRSPFILRNAQRRSAPFGVGVGTQPLQKRSISGTPVTLEPTYVRFGTSGGQGRWNRGPGEPGDGQPPEKGPKPSWGRFGSALVILGGVYYLAHLERVPETGRWRFMNTSPKFEAQMAELFRNQTHEEFRDGMVPPTHPISKHVRRVATRIITSANLGTVISESQVLPVPSLFGSGNETEGLWNPDDTLQQSGEGGKVWEVIVVNDPKMINAQALPGVVIVYTGILPVCQGEEGLAAVLSHEIGHVVARHTAERISSRTIWIAFMVLLQALGLDWGISGLAHTLFMELPNSRTQEREADIIGLNLMANACYDPKASPEMFNRLGKIESKLSGRAGLDFFRTHPASENRVKYLEEILPKAYSIMAANPDCAAIQDQMQAFQEASGGMMRTVPITRDYLRNL